MLKKFLFFIWILLAPTFVGAQVRIETEPSRVEKGSPFVFKLIISSKGIPQNAMPEVVSWGGLKMISGPQSQELPPDPMEAFFDGMGAGSRVYSWKLQAPRVGAFKVGPFVFSVGGRLFKIGEAQIQVSRSASEAAVQLQTSVPKKEYYVGEQIPLAVHFKVFDNVAPGSGLSPVQTDFGNQFFGNWEKSDSVQFKASSEPGVIAQGQMKAYLAPLNAGQIQIPAIAFRYYKSKMERVVEDKKIGPATFHSENIQQKNVPEVANANALPLNILPLPTGAPPKFTGLVGQFKMDVRVNKTDLNASDVFEVNVMIEGNGRPGAIPDPDLPHTEFLRAVPPESKITTHTQNNQLITTKTLKYYFYPKKNGTFDFGPLSLNFFDPQKKAYRTLSSQVYSIHIQNVTESDTVESIGFEKTATTQAYNDQSRSQNNNSLSSADSLSALAQFKTNRSALYTWAVWISLGLLISIALYMAYRYRKKITLNKIDLSKLNPKMNVRQMTNMATRVGAFLSQNLTPPSHQPENTLKEARRFLDQNDYKSACSTVKKALSQTLENKLQKSISGLSREQLLESLIEVGIPPALGMSLNELLDKADILLYSGIPQNAEVLKWISSAEAWLKEWDEL